MISLARFQVKISQIYSILYEGNKTSFQLFLFFFIATISYFYAELILQSIKTSLFLQSAIILFNISYIGYMYYYMKVQKYNSFAFLSYFFLIKYLHLLYSVTWSLAQISLFFDSNSILVGIGNFMGLNLVFVSFVISFGALIIDYAILIMFFKIATIILHKISIDFYFDKGMYNILFKNFIILKQAFNQSKLSKKIQLTLVILIVFFTPVAYSYSMQSFHETNDGIYHLVDAVGILVSYFQKHNGLTGIFSDPNGLLQLKNTLYFSSKDFKISEIQLKSLQSPIYSPIMLLFNLKGQTSTTLTLLNKLSQFTGSTMLNLVASIEDYLSLMYQLTKEILRRAYWWELEQNNITYNPRRDFYDKFNSKTVNNLNSSVVEFNVNYQNLKLLINKSYLSGTSVINNLYEQLDKLESILGQAVYLSRVAPPLLNATFTSVEVTNALAFDQFITAKNLTTLSQKYLSQSQQLLTNYSFDSAFSSPISEIGTIMNEFNSINHEFYNMTYGTQNMFLNISKSIEILNTTSYSTNFQEPNIYTMNININNSLNYVKQIVKRNIKEITGYLNISGSPLGFPFHDILGHFLWFYNGYDTAVDGYRSLWLASNNTVDLFHQSNVLQNSTVKFLDNLPGTPSQFPSLYQSLLNNFTNFKLKIQQIGQEFNQSVTDGAIKVNTTLWDNVLGYNYTFNKFHNTGFYSFIENWISFWNDTRGIVNTPTFLLILNAYKVSSSNLLKNLTMAGVFLSLSEELH